jgi:hypothetical protein
VFAPPERDRFEADETDDPGESERDPGEHARTRATTRENDPGERREDWNGRDEHGRVGGSRAREPAEEERLVAVDPERGAARNAELVAPSERAAEGPKRGDCECERREDEPKGSERHRRHFAQHHASDHGRAWRTRPARGRGSRARALAPASALRRESRAGLGSSGRAAQGPRRRFATRVCTASLTTAPTQ